MQQPLTPSFKLLLPILFALLLNSGRSGQHHHPSSSLKIITTASAFGLQKSSMTIGKNRLVILTPSTSLMLPPASRQQRRRRERQFVLSFGDENNTNESDIQISGGSSSAAAATGSSSTVEGIMGTTTTTIPSFIESPILKELYSDMIQWKELYGHPNIPLKNPGGKLCLTVRRMHIQNKLSPTEIEWLKGIGFIFHSLEEVYKYANFDDMLSRLVMYETTHPDSNFQVPKKCPEDPELGAWVTGLRRLGPDGVNPDHERKLNTIGFQWVSSKQCGSKFMLKYRDLVQQVEERGLDVVLDDPDTVPWIIAQQEALKRGGLSQTRVHYMGQLFGDMWTTIGKPLSRE